MANEVYTVRLCTQSPLKEVTGIGQENTASSPSQWIKITLTQNCSSCQASSEGTRGVTRKRTRDGRPAIPAPCAFVCIASVVPGTTVTSLKQDDGLTLLWNTLCTCCSYAAMVVNEHNRTVFSCWHSQQPLAMKSLAKASNRYKDQFSIQHECIPVHLKTRYMHRESNRNEHYVDR